MRNDDKPYVKIISEGRENPNRGDNYNPYYSKRNDKKINSPPRVAFSLPTCAPPPADCSPHRSTPPLAGDGRQGGAPGVPGGHVTCHVHHVRKEMRGERCPGVRGVNNPLQHPGVHANAESSAHGRWDSCPRSHRHPGSSALASARWIAQSLQKGGEREETRETAPLSGRGGVVGQFQFRCSACCARPTPSANSNHRNLLFGITNRRPIIDTAFTLKNDLPYCIKY